MIAEIGSRVVPDAQGIDWQAMRRTATIRQWIAAVVPGFEAIANIDQTKQEFFIGGRILHQPRFPTADGRARLHAHELPELNGQDGTLRLMTASSISACSSARARTGRDVRGEIGKRLS